MGATPIAMFSNNGAEKCVLSALNAVLLDKGIPVFGGTAGDTGTKVSLNGRVCRAGFYKKYII